jgi:cyanophycinase
MSENGSAPGAIALVGSGDYLPVIDDVDRALIDTLGGPANARVVVIPTASGLEPGMPAQWNERGVAHFRRLGADVTPIMVLDHDAALDPGLTDTLAQANFFYFSGGNPQHVVAVWQDTPAWECLVQRWQQGAVIAGCSAGAMMLGGFTFNIRRAIGGGTPEWLPALGVLPRIATLPHFDQLRRRAAPGLLEGLLESRPDDVTVVGVDEDTALIRFSGFWQVLGRQSVSVFSRDGETRYSAGERVPLPEDGMIASSGTA